MSHAEKRGKLEFSTAFKMSLQVLKRRESTASKRGSGNLHSVAVTAVGDLCWSETPSTGRKTGSQPAPSGGSIHGTFRLPEYEPHIERGAIQDEIATPFLDNPPRVLLQRLCSHRFRVLLKITVAGTQDGEGVIQFTKQLAG